MPRSCESPVDPPVPVPVLLPVAAAPETPAPTSTTTDLPKVPADNLAPRRQLIAGGVMLPLGLVALGVVGVIGSNHWRGVAEADALGLMIALGITGGALVAAGTALLVRGAKQRRRAQLALDLRHNLVGLTIAGRF